MLERVAPMDAFGEALFESDATCSLSIIIPTPENNAHSVRIVDSQLKGSGLLESNAAYHGGRHGHGGGGEGLSLKTK